MYSRDFFLNMNTPTQDDPAFRFINRVIARCHQTATEKGWWDGYDGLEESVMKFLFPDIIAGKLMLIVSEAAEALEEVRQKRGPSEVYYTALNGLDQRVEVAEEDKHRWNPEDLKPEGVPIELADVVIRIFDLAGWLGIDLAEAIRVKMAYNATRPYRHGGKAL